MKRVITMSLLSLLVVGVAAEARSQTAEGFQPQAGAFTSVSDFIGVWEVSETLYAGTAREYVERSLRVCERGVADTYVVCRSDATRVSGDREYWWLMNEPEPGVVEWLSVFSNYPGKGLIRGRILDDGTGIDLRTFELGEEVLEPGSFQRIRFRSPDAFEWVVGLDAPDAASDSGFAVEHSVRVSRASDGALPPQRREPVRIPMSDGYGLLGDVVVQPQAAPGVLLLNMCSRTHTRTDWEPLIDELAGRGYAVLSFDYRGSGDSRSETWDIGNPDHVEALTRHLDADVEDAFRFAQAHDAFDSVVAVVGASCGGFRALDLVATNDEIETVVLMSAGVRQEVIGYLDSEDSVPVLGLGAHDDGQSAMATAEAVSHSLNAASRMVYFDEGGHGTRMFEVVAALPTQIVDWIDTHTGR